ncbi:MAG: chemotaxis protein CheX [Deltaproteobacteria bacterium]|nr:chemotaxis protein CheX [Deltaproteobacteria bacterium]
MNRLETAEMARIVSQVTEPVLGLTFTEAAHPQSEIGPDWRTAALPIAGGTPLTVAVAADDACCRTLSATMFAAKTDVVDDAMMADTLCELVNMTAGLLKSAMRIDQALGLPAMRGTDILHRADGRWSQHYLRAGQLNLVLAVATRLC